MEQFNKVITFYQAGKIDEAKALLKKEVHTFCELNGENNSFLNHEAAILMESLLLFMLQEKHSAEKFKLESTIEMIDQIIKDSEFDFNQGSGVLKQYERYPQATRISIGYVLRDKITGADSLKLSSFSLSKTIQTDLEYHPQKKWLQRIVQQCESIKRAELCWKENSNYQQLELNEYLFLMNFVQCMFNQDYKTAWFELEDVLFIDLTDGYKYQIIMKMIEECLCGEQ